MGRRPLTIIMLFIISLFISPIAFAESYHHRDNQSNSMIFLQQADYAQLIPDLDDLRHGKLILNGIYKNTIGLTDRPDRATTSFTAKGFFETTWWSKDRDSFESSHPNAILIYSNPDKRIKDAPIIVELSKPHFDQKNDRIVYNVKMLDNQHVPRLNHISKPKLIIDNWCHDDRSCW